MMYRVYPAGGPLPALATILALASGAGAAQAQQRDTSVVLQPDSAAGDTALSTRGPGSRAGIRVFVAGSYNRVEGLPISIGPSVEKGVGATALMVEAYAVARTASSFNSQRGEIGYRLRARGDRRAGITAATFGAGATLFDVVDAVESWQLSDMETALAAFLVHRDYRDYFERRGGELYAHVAGRGGMSARVSLSHQRWDSRDLRNPFTLFRNQTEWRPNPAMDEGRMHIATAAFEIDTRNTPKNPWSGWFIRSEIERGKGVLERLGPTTNPRTYGDGARSDYTRGFLDARRYNRLSPNAQLNVRLVAGGRLGGNELPLQRRLSVDGPGAVPGFDFRAVRSSKPDGGTCTAGPSNLAPTECERVVLAQIEYRGALLVGIGEDWSNVRELIGAFDDALTWVMFGDIGRGWLLGEGTPLHHRAGTLPAVSSFRSDIGLGADLGGFGIYAVKAISHPSEAVNFFVRVRRLF